MTGYEDEDWLDTAQDTAFATPIDPNRAKQEALFNRQLSYRATFDFNSAVDMKVLSDLARFCRAGETAFHPDPRVHALIEGRREVWLRIARHLEMDSQTLWKIITRDGG